MYSCILKLKKIYLYSNFSKFVILSFTGMLLFNGSATLMREIEFLYTFSSFIRIRQEFETVCGKFIQNEREILKEICEKRDKKFFEVFQNLKSIQKTSSIILEQQQKVQECTVIFFHKFMLFLKTIVWNKDPITVIFSAQFIHV